METLRGCGEEDGEDELVMGLVTYHSIDVCAIVQQQFNQLLVPILHTKVEWREP